MAGSTTVAARARAARWRVYAVLADVAALAACLEPEGTTSRVLSCDREAQVVRMQITHGRGAQGTRRFRLWRKEARPDELVVYGAEFEGEPALAGEMTLSFALADDPQGTRLTLRHEGLPPGLDARENERGCASALRKIAARAEQPARTLSRKAAALSLFHLSMGLLAAALAFASWRAYTFGGVENARPRAYAEAVGALVFLLFAARAALGSAD